MKMGAGRLWCPSVCLWCPEPVCSLTRSASPRRGLASEMAPARDTAAFAALAEVCAQGQVGQQTLTRAAVILAAKGGPVATTRVGDCVELL